MLGLGRDEKRPTIPGIPGAWINVGEVGQIHLIGGEQPSPVAKGPGEDPTRPHIAFAVKDIVATRKELDRMGVNYWVIEGLTSPDSTQVFMNDPCGNMVELHQVDKCRCRAVNRAAASCRTAGVPPAQIMIMRRAGRPRSGKTTRPLSRLRLGCSAAARRCL